METAFGILWSLSLIGMCVAGKYCYVSTMAQITYCAYGCCGRYYERYCCSMYSWLIVLLVLGVLLLVASVAIALACWKKKKNQGRQAVGTTGNYTTVTYVNQAPTQQPMFYGHPPPPRPPPPSYHHVTSGYQHHQQAYPPLRPGGPPFNVGYPPPPPPKY